MTTTPATVTVVPTTLMTTTVRIVEAYQAQAQAALTAHFALPEGVRSARATTPQYDAMVTALHGVSGAATSLIAQLREAGLLAD